MDQAPNGGYYDAQPEDFDYFVSRCRFYQKEFGLRSWEFYYDFEDLSEKDELACVNWCLSGHSASITMSSKLPTTSRTDMKTVIDRVARHEVIHVGIARFYDYAQRRYLNPEDLDEALEELVRFIDNIYVEGGASGIQND